MLFLMSFGYEICEIAATLILDNIFKGKPAQTDRL